MYRYFLPVLFVFLLIGCDTPPTTEVIDVTTTSLATAVPSSTSKPTNTPKPTATPTIEPTNTRRPTRTPRPTATSTPAASPTPEPLPQPTFEPFPTATILATATNPPIPTNTPAPLPTATAEIAPTDTPVPVEPTQPPPTDPPPPPTNSGSVVITGVNKSAEYVDIQNTGGNDVDLGGWMLRSEKGSQDCYLGGVIAAGQSLRIYALASDSGLGGFNCGFGGPIWNNSEPDPAVLFNADGVEVSRR